MVSMKKFYVYIHTKPNGEVFYVGKGTAKRAYKTSQRNKFWWNVVKKYGYEVKIVKYFDNEEDATNAEIKLVAKYRKANVRLVNLTDGGDGGVGRVCTDETRKRLSKAMSGEGNGFYGHNHTEEVKERISEANSGENNFFYGKKHSAETKEKLRKAWIKRKKIGTSDETRKLLREIRKGKGNGMFGKKHSKATKLKIREKALKRRHTLETKKKISESLKNINHT
jgi:group I intron endonuclease